MRKFPFFFISLILVTMAGAQTPAVFTGQVSFTYSGTINGTFTANTEINPDSLTLPDSGALAVALPDSGATQVFMAAFERTGDQIYQLMVVYLKDETDSLNAQTWTFPTDITNPSALFLFLPEVDSTLVSDLVGLIDTSGVDSSNVDSLFLDVISGLIQEAYLATGGSLNLETSGSDSLGGNFNLFCVKLPFSTLNITSGSFAFSPVDLPALSSIQEAEVPRTFELLPATPNPFNPVTRITYTLDRDSPLILDIYDIRGRLVDHLYKGWNSAGIHRVSWDASRFSSGLYIVRLESAGRGLTQKVLLLK
ncbi:MAG: T9SS type A sorting domain-containing protein [FCB group bacterium]|nr:T9SS type A sorting domain-containing protein [FCB group bacterium]